MTKKITVRTMLKNRLFVVGVGPGSKEYITEKAKKIIKDADLVAGFTTAIIYCKDLINSKAEIVVLDYASEKPKLDMIAGRLKESKKCVICCVGDVNFSDQQFIKKIRLACGQIEVIPGISSVQIAAALAGLAMEDIRFITFHKSGTLEPEKMELIDALKKGRNIILLPRPWDFMPSDIAGFLIGSGISPKMRISVYENLTLENETVFNGNLEGLLGKDFSDLSVMVIENYGKGS